MDKKMRIVGNALHDLTLLYLRNHRELLSGTPEDCAKKYVEIYARISKTTAALNPETLSCK